MCILATTKRCCLAVLLFVTTALSVHRIVSYQQRMLTLVKAPMNYIPRECPRPEYPTLLEGLDRSSNSNNSTYNEQFGAAAVPTATKKKPSICMTTLTDTAKADLLQRLVRWRDFGNVLETTWPNKERYCEKHGYRLFDSSLTALDTSRPPSWSKIKAAQRLLREEDCDWVFWLDADTVIMNSEKPIEAFLPDADSGIDLVLTRQKGTSWNAGAWLIRKSDWSLSFLDTWWNMKSFVRKKGQASSGDNMALKFLLKDLMQNNPVEYAAHIVVPPRCQFNSVAKFYAPEFAASLTPDVLQQSPKLYMNVETYHKGDLIAHVAGTCHRPVVGPDPSRLKNGARALRVLFTWRSRMCCWSMILSFNTFFPNPYKL